MKSVKRDETMTCFGFLFLFQIVVWKVPIEGWGCEREMEGRWEETAYRDRIRRVWLARGRPEWRDRWNP